MKIKYYQDLGKKLNKEKREDLIAKLRVLGHMCFEELPEYQCFSFDCDFKRHIIAVAYSGEKIIGFSSALKLEDEWGETFLHLGLTCVHPHYRSEGLTRKMVGRLTTEYVLRNAPFKKVWFSNIAAVISSLGNVGKSFDQVYPSPGTIRPTAKHQAIANAMSKRYRDLVYIGEDYAFNEDKFIFYGSGRHDICFQKDAHDTRYHHRNSKINKFYLDWIDLDSGDEMIQVGNYSLLTLLRYLVK